MKNNIFSEIYVYFEKISSLHGAITHYYHFFYAVLIPIILKYIEYSKKYEKVVIVINNDLGPMLKILLALPIDIKLKSYISPNIQLKNDYLTALDIAPNYKNTNKNPRDLIWIKKKYATFFTNAMYKKINKWFQEQINKNDLVLQPYIKYDVVVIERKTNMAYYSKESLKKNNIFKTSGAQRRSIINHQIWFNAIKEYFKKLNCISISTEYLPIFDQYVLFNNAKILIAQHGAALANIAFLKENTTVIEIMTQKLLDDGENWFVPLSNVAHVKHLQYVSNDFHININIQDFCKFMSANNL